MERRKFIAGLGSLTAAGAVGIGTGAVDTFQANRTMSVDVVGGASAYLGIMPSESEYVTENSPIQIDLSQATETGGSGVPNNARTSIWPAFTLANQTSNTLYIEAANPLANSDLSEGGVDVQLLAVDDPDGWLVDSNRAVLFDRTSYVTSTGGYNPGTTNPARIPKIKGSNTDTEFVGATNDNPPKYIELGPGEDVSVIVRVFAKDAEPPVELSGGIEIEAYDTEDPMTLSGPAGHLGD